MKTKLTLVALMVATTLCADTIPFDSTALHNQIVNTANGIIAVVPDVNQGVSAVKVILIAIGSTITGWCIHYFKKRNSKK